MNRAYSLDTSGKSSLLSTKAYLLIIFAVLFIIYAFVPPIQDPINSFLGTVFGPLIDMFGLVTDAMNYL